MRKETLGKAFIRWITSALLCVLLVCSMVVPAAATAISGSSGITNWNALTYDWTKGSGSGSVTAADVGDGTAKLTIKAKGYTQIAWYKTSTTNLTFTNPSTDLDVYVTLYEQSHSSNAAKVNGSTAPTTATKYTIAKGGSNKLTITLESTKDKTEQNAVIIIDEIKLEEKNYTTQFDTYTGGSYTISGGKDDGVSKVPGKSYTKSTQDSVYTLTATPSTGYNFAFWVSAADGMISRNTTIEYNPTKNDTIYPIFYDKDAAVYQIVGDKTYYQYFDEVMTVAKGDGNTVKKVKVVASGSVKGKPDSNGNSSTNLEIPSNVQLLVPKDDADNGSFGPLTDVNVSNVTIKANANGTLSVPVGTTITVYGDVNINAQRRDVASSNSGSDSGGVNGQYGLMKLNGTMTLEEGSNLYCYGYIIGEGTVEAKSTSNVYELLQITDWRGGDRTAYWEGDMNTDAVGFTQFYVQNVEADLKLWPGSDVIVETYISGTLWGSTQTAGSGDITMFGSNGLFNVTENGYMLRSYDAKNDRMTYTVHHDGIDTNKKAQASVDKLLINIDNPIGSDIPIDTSKYVAALNSNMILEVEDNAVLSLKQNFRMLPEAKIHVKDGGELVVEKDLILYGLSDWMVLPEKTTGSIVYDYAYVTNTYGMPVNYIATTGKKSSRWVTDGRQYVNYGDGKATARDSAIPVTSAQMIIDGKLTVNSTGGIYTTNARGIADPDKVITGKGVIVNNHGTTRTSINELVGNPANSDGLLNETISVVPAVGFLAGDSTGTTDYKQIGTSTVEKPYIGMGDHWYHHTIEITGAVDQMTSYQGGQFTMNEDGTATGYSITGGTFRFALPYEYVPEGIEPVGTVPGEALQYYEIPVSDNSTKINILKQDVEHNVTFQLLKNGTTEVVEEWTAYVPAGATVTGYFADTDCTIPSDETPIGSEPVIFYKSVGAMIAWAGELSDVTYYDTLADALAIETGEKDVVWMYEDLALAEPMTIAAGSIRNLNVNGCTITYVGSAFNVSGTLDLDLNGGIITNVGADGNAVSGVTAAIKINASGNADIDTTGGQIVVDDDDAAVSALKGMGVHNAGTLALRGNGTISTNAHVSSPTTSGTIVPAIYNTKTITLIRDVQIIGSDVGIYNAGTITTIDGNATIAAGNSSTTGLSAILMKANSSIGTIGGNGTVNISATRSNSSTIYMLGGTSIDTIGGENSTVNISKSKYAINMKSNSRIGDIGSEGATVTIHSSDKALWLEGSTTSVSGTIGAEGSNVEIVSTGSNAIQNPGTIHELGSGVTVVTAKAKTYAVNNTGTITTISGGNYYAKDGSGYIFSGTVNYPEGRQLSTDTRSVTLADGTTKYNCYYVTGGHVHTEETVAGKAATCTESGLTEGKKCTVCGETTLAQTEIPALGHNMQETTAAVGATCGEAGKTAVSTCANGCGKTEGGEVIPALGHTKGEPVIENKMDSTCTADGSYETVTSCTGCGAEISRVKTTVDALGHDEVDHDAKAPTCTEKGWDAYVTCSRCEYTTYAEKTELGHNEVDHEAKAPTCSETGWDAYVTCTRCDYTTYVEKAALGHDEVEHDAKAPTCEAVGWDAYVTCTRCDYTTYVEKAALGHDEVNHDAKAPTCSEKGWDAYVTCSRCEYTTYVEKAELGHNEGEVVIENNVDPGCEIEGSYDNVVYCTVCGEELSRENVTVDAMGHNYNSVVIPPTYDAVGYTTHTCERCGHSYTDSEVPTLKAVAEVNGVKFGTLADAVNAAKASDSIKLLVNVECSEPIVLAEGAILDLNEKSIKGTVIGTISINSGTLITAEGYRMAGPNADYYQTSDAVVTILINGDVTVQSGTMTVVPTEWWTGKGQILTICEGATFVLPEGKTMQVLSYVIVEGTAVVDGTVNLYSADAMVIAGEGLNITTTAGDKVWYSNGKYVVHSHTVVSDEAVEATCTAAGKTEGKHCSVCDDVLEAQTVIDALGHDEVSHDAKAPTCEEKGWDAYVTCSRCDYTTYVEKAALDHTDGEVVAENKVDPDCVNAGSYDNVVYCTVCGEELSRETVTIDALGHTDGETVVENKVDPDCVNEGSYDNVVYCTVCGEELSRETVTVDALGHNYNSVVTAPTYGAGGYTTHTCERCGHSYTDSEVPALKAVAEVNGAKFGTLADAVVAAKDGETVTLMEDASGMGMVIDKSITIDFNNHTYTFTEGVGSNGTESNGFQILQGNTVTLKNGELKVSEAAKKVFYMLVQNYANLTVKDMTLDGTNLDKWSDTDGDSYVLSNNSGTVNIIGETDIIANNEGAAAVAVDACQYKGYAAPSVIINTTGTISGTVEVTGGQMTVDAGTFNVNGTECADVFVCDSGKLTINEGTVNGGSANQSTAVWAKSEGNVTINGGTFNIGADETAEGGYNDLIYARDNAVVTITGGHFDGPARTDGVKFLLNLKDGSNAKFVVSGGTFVGFNPADSGTEPAGTVDNFCKEGYGAAYDETTGTYGVREHIEGETVVENNVDPDCVNDGSYDNVIYCTVCGEELSRKTVTVDALGHDYEEVVTAPTCTDKGYTTYTCTCGETYTDNETEATGHNLGDWIVDQEADCETDGSKHKECANCDYEETEVIKATGHTEGEVVVENKVDADCETDGSYDNVVYCTVCGEELSRETVTVDALGHDYEAVVTAPTCTDKGYTTYTCACGETYKDNETEATGHNLGDWIVDQEADCETDGSKHKECANCDYEETEVIKATGHTEGEVVVENKVDADCETDGSYDNVVYCTVCGEELSRNKVTVDALGHDYEAVVTAPTCTDKGYTTYTCACGETYKDNETEATGHNLGDWIVDQEADCETDGSKHKECANCDYEETEVIKATGHTEGEVVVENKVDADCETDGSYDNVVYCTVCSEELSRETVTVDALGHDYEAVVTAPTCTVGGYTTYTCACGETYKDNETEATGHNLGDWIVDQEADCETDGSKHKECANCDYEETEVIKATGHSYEESVTEKATCTEPGTKTFTCACGETYTEEIKALGHDAVSHDAKTPTCTEKGWDAYVTCNRCDYTTYVEKAATGHNLGDWIIDSEAGCGTAGSKHRECKNCDYTVTETIEATGSHSYATETERVDATCTVDGYVIKACSCGATEKTVLTAKGHSYGEGVVTKEATATEDGEMTYTCGTCGTTKTEVIPATGAPDEPGDQECEHVAGEAVVENEVDATCTKPGSYDNVTYCTVCGEELSRETVDVEVKEHSYGEGVVTKEATDTEDGEMTYTCGTCGTTKTEVIPATGGSVDGDEPEIVVTNPKNGTNITYGIEKEDNGNWTLTLSADDTTKTYVYLVKYTDSEGNESVKQKNASGKYSDGEFAIPANAVSVTVQSVLLGDVTGDGSVKSGDYKKLKDYLMEKIDLEKLGELGELAGDVTGDGRVKSGDYKKIKDYLMDKVTKL